MKTLVVLSALAAIATAAPASPQSHYGGHHHVPYQFTPTFRRDKKAAHENGEAPALDIQTFPARQNELSEVSARSFALKKPIIVKNNKLGYHLYRDSTEEMAQADSQENCTKEVKVKLCNAENLQAKASELKENDMEHSIKRAKEAVENLQKITDRKLAESGPDAELHKDIEVARQALEHIQQNFGNLETLNLRATTLSDAEALKDAHLQISKEGRLAQWKEAVQSIHGNSEIAQNLESSLTTNSHPQTFEAREIKSTKEENIHNELNKDEKLASSLDSLKQKAASAEHENLEMEASASEIHESIIKNEHEHTLKARDDIPVKPFEEIPENTANLGKSDSLENDIQKNMLHEDAKSATIDSSLSQPETSKNVDTKKVESTNMKAAESNVAPKEPKEKETDDKKTSVVPPQIDEPTMKLKAAEVSADLKHETAADSINKENVNDLEMRNVFQNANSAWIETIDKDMQAKASEQSQVKTNEIETNDKDMQAKASEQSQVLETKLKSEEAKHPALQAESLPAMRSSESHDNLHEIIDKNNAKNANTEMKLANNDLTNEKNEHLQKKINQENTMKISNLEKSDNLSSAMKSADQEAHMSEPVKHTLPATALHPHFDIEMLPKMAEIANTEHAQSVMKDASFQATNLHPQQMEMKASETNHLIEQHPSHMETFKPHHSQMEMKATEADHLNAQRPLHVETFQAQEKAWSPDHMAEMKNAMVEQNNADLHDMAQRVPTFEQHGHGHFPVHHQQHFNHLHHGFHPHHSDHFHNMHGVHGIHNHHMHGLHFKDAQQAMVEGKAAEADSAVQATMQVNINDVAGKSAVEHNAWKEGARGAYGAYGTGGLGAIGAASSGLAGGPGAIGVFPHGSTGGCAIPLLLSCSPSVVSGSLAKAHSGYGASAYRAGEPVNFHHKRETKKITEIPAKVKRTPTKVIQKIPEKKN